MEDRKESKSHIVFAVASVVGAISFVVTALRVFTRVKIVGAWGKDDVLMVIAQLFGIVFLVSILVGASNGAGSHIETVPHAELVTFLKTTWVSSTTYNWQSMFSKLSVLTFYRRVMGHHHWFKLATTAMMVFVVLTSGATVLVIFAHCQPISYFWDRSIPGGHCLDITILYYFNSASSIFADVVVTILPLPLTLRLELPKRQKFGLCAIFSLGGFVCATGVVRMIELPDPFGSKDITWDTVSTMLWYYTEASFIIIAACAPALKPFFSLYMPVIIGSAGATHKNSASYQIGQSYDMPRFQRSANVTTGPRAKYGEGDSEEHIIGGESSIMKTTDVVLTVEQFTHVGGSGEQGRETPE
ncbi:unnamed protein product [Tuber aestivum]|uniref:Rhodopsin domain-containing protein n=1 Tax=Tuber aestivum TaxID=59557 RepID=A0A292PMF1_9PEZI|nr:unnamed protein product [Tuber aestivum]